MKRRARADFEGEEMLPQLWYTARRLWPCDHVDVDLVGSSDPKEVDRSRIWSASLRLQKRKR
jgi:hypothetical protein